MGGFCAGNRQVVSHQRLSGAGYCFSASLPAYATCAALAAVRLLAAEPQRCDKLRAVSAAMHASLAAHVAPVPLVELTSDPASPLAHVRLAGHAVARLDPARVEEVLLQAADAARAASGGAAIQLMRHSGQAHVQAPPRPPPALPA